MHASMHACMHPSEQCEGTRKVAVQLWHRRTKHTMGKILKITGSTTVCPVLAGVYFNFSFGCAILNLKKNERVGSVSSIID
mmetsp:Transcript_16912/g.46445  ORF Transcript_16912/g.46445 Transcript_16912/m.46445 type:complete len:81 (+) Transcript_16912:159-401(+)